MTKFRKVSAILLTLAMLLSMFPSMVFASEGAVTQAAEPTEADTVLFAQYNVAAVFEAAATLPSISVNGVRMGATWDKDTLYLVYTGTVEAPAITVGYTAGVKCSVCDAVLEEVEEIAANGHTLTQVDAKAPTCTEKGYKAYEFCSVCDYTTFEEVAATGHSYNGVVTEPTCTAEGYTTYTCSACGDSYVADKVAAKGHDHKATVTAPTCTAQGYTTYTCACGDTYVADYVNATGHTEVAIQTPVAPTCTTPGATAGVKCSVCGEVLEAVEEIPVIDHSYNGVVTEPTCTAEGYTTYTCSACGDSYVADKVAAKGHTEAEAVQENVVNASCTVAGYYESVVYCSVCDEELSRTPVTGAKLPHTEGTPVRENEVEATLNAPGSYEEVVYCSVCNEELSRVEKEIAQLTGAVAEIDGYYYATLEAAIADANGKTVKLLANIEVAQTVVVPAGTTMTLNLNGYSITSTVPGTVCGFNGVGLTNSGNLTIIGEGTIDANYGAVYNDLGATLTINGGNYVAGIGFGLVNDGDATINGGTFDGIGTFNPGSLTLNGGVINVGTDPDDAESEEFALYFRPDFVGREETISVTINGGTINGNVYAYDGGVGEFEIFDITDGTFNGEFVGMADAEPNPPVVSGGTFATDVTDYCIEGYHTVLVDGVYVYGPHSYTSVVTDPTCTEKGFTTYTCACGDEYIDDEVAALGHTEGTPVQENVVDATLNAPGSYDEVVYCSVCNTELSRVAKEIAQLTGAAASVDGVYYATLQEAIDAANGKTVVIEKDITLTDYISVSNTVTINLNGKTITGDFDSAYGVIYVGIRGNLTIEGEGTITSAYTHAVAGYGVITINGGNYVGGINSYGEQCAGVRTLAYGGTTYGTATINGGTFNRVQNCGIMTVNGGTIENLDNTHKLTIENGTINKLIVKAADYVVAYGTSVTINGGTFIGDGDYGLIYVEGGNVEINGGSFEATLGAENYSMAIWAKGGETVIKGGTFKNATDGSARGTDLIYASANGVVVIEGGVFEAAKPEWTLNLKDADRATASITVKGGEFVNFDPANNGAEGANTNFLADKTQHTMKTGDVYTICTCSAKAPVEENRVEATLNAAGSYDMVTYCECGKELSRESFVIDQLTGAVAEIDGYYYATLQEAIDAAEGKTVKLLANVNMNGVRVNITTNCTLNLNGYTLTSKDGGGSNTMAIYVQAGKNFVLEGEGTIVSSCYGIYVREASFTMNGGKLVVTGNGAYDFGVVSWNATFTMNGGVIEARVGVMTADYWSDVASSVVINNGTINISGKVGNYGDPSVALVDDPAYSKGATISVLGGSFNSDVSEFIPEGAHMKCVEGIYTICTGAAKAPVEENRVEATLNAAGSYDMVTYCECGKELSRESFVIDQLTGAVAEIDGFYYATLQEAIDAAEGKTVKLLENIVLPSSGVTITKNVTINLNGKNITSEGDIFVITSGTLTVNGEGEITANTDGVGDANAAWVKGGNLVINGGTWSCGGDADYEGSHTGDMIYTNNGGTVVINGGYFKYVEGVWTLNENDANRGTIFVYGGEFEGFDPANNVSEGANTNFLADKTQHTMKTGNVYTICTCSAKAPVEENRVEADCTTAGSYDMVTYCECGKELNRESFVIEATGHRFSNVQVHSATCTEAGWITLGCGNCDGEWDSRYDDEAKQYLIDNPYFNLAAKGHTEGEVVVENEVAADCVTNGSYDNVVYCTVCGEEISRETITVDALGHTEGEVVVENEVAAGCTTTGSYDNVVYCTECDAELSRETITVEAKGHKSSKVEVVSATCTVDGYLLITCNACGETFDSREEGFAKDYLNGPLGQFFDLAAKGHSYDAVVTDPTCTEDGYTTYTCSVCGDTYTADEVDALGHSYTEEITTAATCTVDGLKTFTCTCGDSYTEVITAPGHDWAEASCTAPSTCTVCGETTGEALIHVYDIDGDYILCTGCNAPLRKQVIKIDGAYYLTSYAGLIQKNYSCYLTDPHEDLAAGKHYFEFDAEGKMILNGGVGHNYKAVVTAPTCTAEGYTTYTCSGCGDSYVADRVDALGHNYVGVVTAPTCTAEGYTTYTCSICGDSYVADKTEKIEHTWIKTDCTANSTCSVCGETKEDAGEHIYDIDGEYINCVNCDAPLRKQVIEIDGAYYLTSYAGLIQKDYSCYLTDPHEDLAAGTHYFEFDGDGKMVLNGGIGHNYKAVVTAPTCTEEGYTTYTCSCGESYVADTVAALDHTWTKADCTANSVCSVCGETKEDAGEHIYGVDGEYINCENCDAPLRKQVITLDGHTYKTDYYGAILKNHCCYIDGVYCEFDENGWLIEEEEITDGKVWIDGVEYIYMNNAPVRKQVITLSDGHTYKTAYSGAILKDHCCYIDGVYTEFDSEGRMIKYADEAAGIEEIDGVKYIFRNSQRVRRELIEVDGVYYLTNYAGQIQMNVSTYLMIDGVKTYCEFDGNGALSNIVLEPGINVKY